MCLILLHFQPCAGSEPDCNCCLSNKYTYMQLRSPEVTRVIFHLSHTHTHTHTHTNTQYHKHTHKCQNERMGGREEEKSGEETHCVCEAVGYEAHCKSESLMSRVRQVWQSIQHD